MHVGPKPDVVGEVPACMVGVLVEDDRVAIPEPTVDAVECLGSSPAFGRTGVAVVERGGAALHRGAPCGLNV